MAAPISSSSFSLLTTLQTLDAATARVLPPLLTYPPPPLIEFYHTYIALNPIVSHFFLTILFTILTIPFAFFFNNSYQISPTSPPQCILLLVIAWLYAAHPYLSQDKRLDSYDLKLLQVAALTTIYVLVSLIASIKNINTAQKTTKIQPQTTASNPIISGFQKVFTCMRMTLLSSLLQTPFYFLWLSRGLSYPTDKSLITMVIWMGVTSLIGEKFGLLDMDLRVWNIVYCGSILASGEVVNWSVTGLVFLVLRRWGGRSTGVLSTAMRGAGRKSERLAEEKEKKEK